MTPPAEPAARFEPRAVRELSGMFDDVSGRYDLLNSILSLGQDGAWRAAMWRAVPETARACLDLCTGNGASLRGLIRPGRLVLGIDASFGMLERAASTWGSAGWAPRLTCADAFRLPLGDQKLDAVTVAFGVRNLRPRVQALEEMARVLRPGGTLAVLEALAPRPGLLAGPHGFYLRHLVPFAGRLSQDPSAYRYLSESIFEFGDGDSFERDLAAAGFVVESSRRFLFGAVGLWTARRAGQLAGRRAPGGAGSGENQAGTPNPLQVARPGVPEGGRFAQPASAAETEWRAWTLSQLGFSVALVVALAWALRVFVNLGSDLPLEPWQRRGLGFLIVAGLVVFAARALVLALRLQGRAPRR